MIRCKGINDKVSKLSVPKEVIGLGVNNSVANHFSGEVGLIPQVELKLNGVKFIICELEDKDFDTRSLLRNKVMSWEENFSIITSFEVEFYLIKEGKPYDNKGYLEPIDVKILKFLRLLKRAGIEVASAIKEDGNGQYEVALKHDNPLKVSDEFVFLKLAVKNYFSEIGVEPNFMPKPFPNLPSSGLHLNISLWRDGRNLFYDGGRLSDFAYNFIGGVLEHVGALAAIVAPTINSYKRLNSMGIRRGYGEDRGSIIRIPNDGRIEFRIPDPTANPYLVMVSTIEAGLDGVERGLKPSVEVELPQDLRELPV
jgi:glutamine synthetase